MRAVVAALMPCDRMGTLPERCAGSQPGRRNFEP
jgi:hypothetical protein